MADLIWSWALTIVGATCFYLAGGLNGRKVWWAWYIGLFAQALWFTYAVLDLGHRMGFLVGVALYGFVYVRNCVNWTREHRAEKRAAAQRSRMIRTIAEQLDVPLELIDSPRREWCKEPRCIYRHVGIHVDHEVTPEPRTLVILKPGEWIIPLRRKGKR